MSGNWASNALYQGNATGGANPLYQGPSHKYPSQVIVQFVTGDAGDSLIDKNAKALDAHGKALGIKSCIVQMRASGSLFRTFSKAAKGELTTAFGKLNTLSRVYLQAHGDWESQKLGEWGPHDVAAMLAECGMPAVRVVSILGCELGRDRGTANDARIGNSVDSFASRFHKRLKEKHGIATVVYARVFCVAFARADNYIGDGQADRFGRKVTFDADDDWDDWASAHGRTHSKLRFYWENGQQRREVMN